MLILHVLLLSNVPLSWHQWHVRCRNAARGPAVARAPPLLCVRASRCRHPAAADVGLASGPAALCPALPGPHRLGPRSVAGRVCPPALLSFPRGSWNIPCIPENIGMAGSLLQLGSARGVRNPWPARGHRCVSTSWAADYFLRLL